mmetsp:Transcript_17708/g.32007  ORF Transcript_17708/g.32007 Transcript_17708/m.32007 type:complete len:218 (-) Transcript_17708:497-1150(-)
MSPFPATDLVVGAALLCVVVVSMLLYSLLPNGHSRSECGTVGVGCARHAKASLMPLNACVLIPSILTYFGGGPQLFFGSREPSSGGFTSTFTFALAAFVSSVLLAFGLTLLLWTNVLFHKAEGTLGPWDPPRTFVVSGPYQYVRNPMLAGVIIILIGEGILLGQTAIIGFAVAFVAINTAYFARKEEPALKERFGADYESYFRAVPRWIPRVTPYRI